MALFAPGDNKPWRGCEVFDLNGEIAKVEYNPQTRSVSHRFIPLDEQLVKRIFDPSPMSPRGISTVDDAE
jgi:hypothetical protein